jgi:hypothetical protein
LPWSDGGFSKNDFHSKCDLVILIKGGRAAGLPAVVGGERGQHRLVQTFRIAITIHVIFKLNQIK